MNVVKKPIPAVAVEYTGKNVESVQGLLALAGSVEKFETCFSFQDDELYVNTLEGEHHVTVGSFVIRGNFDDFWSIKKEIFEATYEIQKKEEYSETFGYTGDFRDGTQPR